MEAQYNTPLSQGVSAEKPVGVAENFNKLLTGQATDQATSGARPAPPLRPYEKGLRVSASLSASRMAAFNGTHLAQ
jgi:hypothetical protein